jgi:hypothetical protein
MKETSISIKAIRGSKILMSADHFFHWLKLAWRAPARQPGKLK